MDETNSGRRQFLQSTATVGALAVTGVIAATGTARATKEIEVNCDHGSWEYGISSSNTIWKKDKAEGNDDDKGDYVVGHIAGGYLDNYGVGGRVTPFVASHDSRDSYIYFNINQDGVQVGAQGGRRYYYDIYCDDIG